MARPSPLLFIPALLGALGGALTITRRSQEIAWLYESVAGQRSPKPPTQAQTFAPDRVFPAGEQSMLYIHLADGKSFTLWVAPENAARKKSVPGVRPAPR